MALQVTSKSQQAEHPIFLSILEDMNGGVLVKVDSRVPAGLHTLWAGTPIATNGTAGEYMFMKSAIVATAKADGATRIVIQAPNPFKVGDYIGFDKSGTAMGAGSVVTITAVAATYIATPQTNFTLVKKDVIYEATASGATAPKFRPYALLKDSVIVRETDGTTAYNVFGSGVVRGAVAVSNYNWGYPGDVKNRLEDRVRFVDKGLK